MGFLLFCGFVFVQISGERAWSGLIVDGVGEHGEVPMVRTDYSMKAKQSQYFAVKPSLCISGWTCLAVLCVEICGSWDALDD